MTNWRQVIVWTTSGILFAPEQNTPLKFELKDKKYVSVSMS